MTTGDELVEDPAEATCVKCGGPAAPGGLPSQRVCTSCRRAASLVGFESDLQWVRLRGAAQRHHEHHA
jgi:hypothetical protein